MVSSMAVPHFYYDALLRKTIAWKGVPLLKAFVEMEHPRDEAGRFTAGNTGTAAASSEAKAQGHTVTQDLALLASLLQTGKSAVIHHAQLGAITVDAGTTGKSGYGIKHIIEQRYAKDGKSEEDIAALIPLVIDAAKNGRINRDNEKLIELEKNGIVAIISKHRFEKTEQWLLTGFDNSEKEEEATGAIQTVIAKYSYTPEYSYFRKQVGAVIASLDQSSSKASEKSSIKNLKKALAVFETAQNNAELEQTMNNIRWKLTKWQLEQSVYQR